METVLNRTTYNSSIRSLCIDFDLETKTTSEMRIILISFSVALAQFSGTTLVMYLLQLDRCVCVHHKVFSMTGKASDFLQGIFALSVLMYVKPWMDTASKSVLS